MLFYCFWQLKIIAQPIYGAKCIYVIHLKYLAVFSIISAEGLINEIEDLSTKTKKRKKRNVGLNYYLNILFVHLYGYA